MKNCSLSFILLPHSFEKQNDSKNQILFIFAWNNSGRFTNLGTRKIKPHNTTRKSTFNLIMNFVFKENFPWLEVGTLRYSIYLRRDIS